jgi:hypothetical protein
MTQGGGNDEMDRAKRRGIFAVEPIKCLTVMVPRRFAHLELPYPLLHFFHPFVSGHIYFYGG